LPGIGGSNGADGKGWSGDEYLARFKRDGTKAQKTAHAAYKSWTSATRQKQMAGFSASLRSRAGDDSLDQSLE
jgi:hypothetical protein